MSRWIILAFDGKPPVLSAADSPVTIEGPRMTGDVLKAARWVGLSLIVSSVIVVVGLRWPTPKPAPVNDPVAGNPSHLAGSDKDRFQGMWKLDSSYKYGSYHTGSPGDFLRVDGDRLDFIEKSEPFSFTGRWDETKNPKTLTLTPLSRDAAEKRGFKFPLECIYMFDGDMLVIALSEPPTRAADFKPDEKAHLIWYKKTDEKPAPPRKQTPTTSRK
jgi:uncharacterized protein (TIGR03067 family)